MRRVIQGGIGCSILALGAPGAGCAPLGGDGQDGQVVGGEPAQLTYQPRTDITTLSGVKDDEHCKLSVVAPMARSNLVSPVDVVGSSQVTRSGGASTMSGGTIGVTSPTVTLQFKSGATNVAFRAAGFAVQNGSGSLAKNSSANLAEPLLVQIESLDASEEVIGVLRFWTYQGLRPGSDSSDAQYDGIGRPETGMEATPAYLGIGGARALPTAPAVTPISKVRFTVLAGDISTQWTIKDISYTTSPGSSTCWAADSGWRLISDPNEEQEVLPGDFTHSLRTEAHETHAGHTVGAYWEFNRYGSNGTGTVNDTSWLQGSGISGNLTSPLVQLRDIQTHCDFQGQGDVPGLFHFSHFHFQGFHETEDNNPGDPDYGFEGFGEVGPPPAASGLYEQYCLTPTTNYFKDEIYVCEAYELCTELTPLTTLDPVLGLANLGDTYCGATCIQTMQVEKHACAQPPETDDKRRLLYSLNNGRTWRAVNWMKDRYHSGYPGSWHYNHTHPAQDGDGMLGMDDYYEMEMGPGDPMVMEGGFDWDQDGTKEKSTGVPCDDSGVNPQAEPCDDQFDPQFGVRVDTEGPMIAPAMRFRFRFEEDGNTAQSAPGWNPVARCVDSSGDGHCAGWRVDDVALDYDEECPSAAKFYDSLEPTNPGDNAVWPLPKTNQVCAATGAAYNQLLNNEAECSPVVPADPDEQAVHEAMLERMMLMGM